MAQLETEYNYPKNHLKHKFSFNFGRVLNYQTLLVSMAAFLSARAEMFDIMAPFGIALVAACSTTSRKRALAAFFSLVGIITIGTGGADPAKYISVLAVFLAVQIAIERMGRKTSLALTATLTMFAVGFAAVVMQGFTPYDMVMLLPECIICYVSVLIFQRAVFLAESFHEHRVAATEESVSMCILIGVCILGFSEISLPWGISISNTLCAAAILMVALNGTGPAALTGLGCGVISSLSYFPVTDSMGAYAMCGLAAGLMRRFGKAGVTVGFVVCNTLIHMYFRNWNDIVFNVYEQVIAICIMWIVPANAIERVGEIVGSGIPGTGSGNRIKGVITRRLYRTSESFDALAESLNSLTNWSESSCEDITVVFDEAASRVCKRCKNAFRCWQHEFNTTYDSLMHIKPVLEEYGSIEVSHLPDYFANRCVKVKEYVAEINNQYGNYRVESIWQKKIDNSRKLVTDQLHDVSKIVSNISQQLTGDVQFDVSAEERIITELKKKNIRPIETTVVYNSQGKTEVDMTVHACGDYSCYGDEIITVVSSVLKKTMRLSGTHCGATKGKGRCNIRFTEQTVYEVECGSASCAKDGQGENGDNLCYMPMNNDKYIMAISDGMGSGKKASNQSGTTVELISKFLDAGFDKSSAVKLINSILLLRSADEVFATIDITMIDLNSGDGEFIKIGANTAYIKRGNKVRAITAASLPAGILGDVDIETQTEKLQNGDCIIMLSDGIESIDSLWVERFVSDMHSMHPQLIADCILERAIDRQGGATDDMSVLVGYIKEAC